jgi:hypothetical protein
VGVKALVDGFFYPLENDAPGNDRTGHLSPKPAEERAMRASVSFDFDKSG